MSAFACRPCRPAVAVLAIALAGWIASGDLVASQAKPPVSFGRADLGSARSVGAWAARPVEVTSLLREDAANARRGDVPLRIGWPMATDLSPANSGTWESLSRGEGRVWRLRVETAGALWTVLGFDVFRLPFGASLWVYDPDGLTVLGPFTGADIQADGQLWMPPIEGDRLVVELFWPETLADDEARVCTLGPFLTATSRSDGSAPPRRVRRDRGVRGLGLVQHRHAVPARRRLAGREARRGRDPPERRHRASAPARSSTRPRTTAGRTS